jgi:hypothetical protein
LNPKTNQADAGLFFQRLSGFARPLAGTSISTCTLTTARQALAMTHTAITTKIHETLDVHRDFTTQITLNDEFSNLVAKLL